MPFFIIGAGAVLVVLYVLVGASRAEAFVGSPSVGSPSVGGLRIQSLPSVNWSGVSGEIVYALGVADAVYRAVAGQPVVVTSLTDSSHMAGSLHFTGNAADIRTRTLSASQLAAVVAELKSRLTSGGFDVVLESDHIHIEYDPKAGRFFLG